MNFKKMCAGSIIVCMSIVSTISFDLSTIHAKNNSAADTLYFYDSKDDGSAIDYIKNATQEDSFDKLRQNYGDFKNIVVEDDEQTLKFKNYSQAAFPIEIVKENKELREQLKEYVKEGNRLYLYGENVFLKEFEELLGIQNEITPPTEEDMKSSSGEPKLYIANSNSFNVVGFTMDRSTPIYLATFSDGAGNKISSTKDYMHLQAILDHKLKYEKSTTASPLENKASDGPTIVATVADQNHYVYISGTNILKGQINTDYVLRKDNNETDSTYDYFGIEDNVEITGYNGAVIEGANYQHSFPYTGDQIYDWSPGSTSSSGGQVSVSVQYGSGVTVSYTFDANGNINVHDNSSQTQDYSLWAVTPNLLIGFLPNPTRFKPSTTWFSTGTYAAIDLTHDTWFEDGLGRYYGYQVLEVRYDY